MKWTVVLLTLVLVQGSPFTTVQRQDVIRSMRSILADGYVDEDVGRGLAQLLEKNLERGEFEKMTEPAAFASAIENLLQAETRDRHLLVWHGPFGAILERAPTLSGPAVAKSEVLSGNLGYIEVRNFLSPDNADFDKAMTVVNEASALIFDLRGNPGGNSSSVQHLSTYLFAKRTHLLNRSSRGLAAPIELWTLETIPGKRLPDVPVYVLTSRLTFSAGEMFAFALKATGRATVVGETTGGGGHSGRLTELPHGFSMFLPTGRSFDPRTGKGWQVEGVHPDVEVPAAQALDAAVKRLRERER